MDTNAPFLTLQELEESHIRAALERTDGNITKAALLLGIDRQTIYRRRRRMAAGVERRAVALRRNWNDPDALRARLAELEGK